MRLPKKASLPASWSAISLARNGQRKQADLAPLANITPTGIDDDLVVEAPLGTWHGRLLPINAPTYDPTLSFCVRAFKEVK